MYLPNRAMAPLRDLPLLQQPTFIEICKYIEKLAVSYWQYFAAAVVILFVAIVCFCYGYRLYRTISDSVTDLRMRKAHYFKLVPSLPSFASEPVLELYQCPSFLPMTATPPSTCSIHADESGCADISDSWYFFPMYPVLDGKAGSFYEPIVPPVIVRALRVKHGTQPQTIIPPLTTTAGSQKSRSELIVQPPRRRRNGGRPGSESSAVSTTGH